MSTPTFERGASGEPCAWVYFGGHRVAAYVHGAGDEAVLALNDGPGLARFGADDIREVT